MCLVTNPGKHRRCLVRVEISVFLTIFWMILCCFTCRQRFYASNTCSCSRVTLTFDEHELELSRFGGILKLLFTKERLPSFLFQFRFNINPRPTRGDGYHPPNGFFLSPQNTNQCGLRRLGNCLFIICAHFEVKNLGVPPSPGVGYSVKVQG